MTESSSEAARQCLKDAVDSFTNYTKRTPSSDAYRTLSGVDGQLRAYFDAVMVARSALADAAKTADDAIIGIVQATEDLDNRLAAKIESGSLPTNQHGSRVIT